ncbi:hypothetical protein [Paraburkholderia aromaticivorans]|uniref:hypothetical protein n=1 Tax=Paraburkholderia aromaticivorans TaxID=2026199 RepID=UPI001455E0EE|nr:hypothetical protein [Paraburkholderia aromaticivorans]
MTVRAFLNIPPNWGVDTIFVDALDEKRTGSGDDNVVDAIVQKLFLCPPAKLLLSCREQDWLGESDLEAFKPYLDANGGVTVLGLSALTAEEQCAVLQDHGVQDPSSFLHEANVRDLGGFLHNPQNLIMLATVVANGSWPESRSQLFRQSTQLWLAEHNPEHARKDEYSADELRPIAGALCALRLISDIEGFALNYSSGDASFPGISTVPFLDRDKVQAALRRRIFTATPGVAAVDYAHRTTAEFLAAEWIASQLDNGLSFRRVTALIGLDGHPATELRGLHAWLAVFAPKFSASSLAIPALTCYRNGFRQ